MFVGRGTGEESSLSPVVGDSRMGDGTGHVRKDGSTGGTREREGSGRSTEERMVGPVVQGDRTTIDNVLVEVVTNKVGHVTRLLFTALGQDAFLDFLVNSRRTVKAFLFTEITFFLHHQ